MAECKNCKYALWDDIEYSGTYGCGKYCFVSDCELGNDEEDCQDFEEYLPPLPDGF